MTERYTIFSEAGDEYRLQFTTDRSNIIADRILDLLLQDGIEVVEVGLGRVGSTNVTSHRVLQQIEESIADFMTRNPNAILSYMCDFINLVPSNKKITVQEYRSRMFSAMFKRYMSQHHIVDIYDLPARGMMAEVRGLTDAIKLRHPTSAISHHEFPYTFNRWRL